MARGVARASFSVTARGPVSRETTRYGAQYPFTHRSPERQSQLTVHVCPELGRQ